MKEFLEKHREREPEPDIELLLWEGDGMTFSFLNRHDLLLIQKFHKHAIWDTENGPGTPLHSVYLQISQKHHRPGQTKQLPCLQTFSSLRLKWKLHKRGTNSQKTLNKNPRNQITPAFTCTVANKLPKQTRNKPTKAKRKNKQKTSECTYQAEIWRSGVEICSNVTDSKCKNHRQKNSRASLRKTKQNTEGRRNSTLRKNAVGKMQQSAQYAIYRGTAPRYTKRSATLSLKRHAA